TEVARDDDSVEGSGNPQASELLVEQTELGFGLLDLGAQDLRLGKLLLGQCLGVFPLLLGALCRPFQPLEPQVAIVERGHYLARLHKVTGASLRVGKISGNGCCEDTLYRALEVAVCRYAVLALGE